MQPEIQKDIGEEIITKLKDLSFKIDKLLETLKNEKELSNSPIPRNTA